MLMNEVRFGRVSVYLVHGFRGRSEERYAQGSFRVVVEERCDSSPGLCLLDCFYLCAGELNAQRSFVALKRFFFVAGLVAVVLIAGVVYF